MAEEDHGREVLLIHGGLAEEIGSRRFWGRPGIKRALGARGWAVLAPDRDTTPSSWGAATAEMVELIRGPVAVVAASNGVSIGLLLALEFPAVVSRLVLLWPATAGDPEVDCAIPRQAAHLLAGETVRGLSDADLAAINIPVAVMAASPENPHHQHRTVDALVETIPGAVRVEQDFPECVRPEFEGRIDRFADALVSYLQ